MQCTGPCALVHVPMYVLRSSFLGLDGAGGQVDRWTGGQADRWAATGRSHAHMHPHRTPLVKTLFLPPVLVPSVENHPGCSMPSPPTHAIARSFLLRPPRTTSAQPTPSLEALSTVTKDSRGQAAIAHVPSGATWAGRSLRPWIDSHDKKTYTQASADRSESHSRFVPVVESTQRELCTLQFSVPVVPER